MFLLCVVIWKEFSTRPRPGRDETLVSPYKVHVECQLFLRLKRAASRSMKRTEGGARKWEALPASVVKEGKAMDAIIAEAAGRLWKRNASLPSDPDRQWALPIA